MQKLHFVKTLIPIIFLSFINASYPLYSQKITADSAKKPVAKNSGQNLISISDQEAAEIGKLIWHNESRGKIEGLTAWNHGEDFASLGIAHFIWYPANRRGPFIETFPAFIRFLKSNGVAIPAFIDKSAGCPWADRKSFMQSFQSSEMVDLRNLLKNTIHHQVRFAALRLEQALPAMLAAAPAKDHARIRENFFLIARQPKGFYALMDYVNFKGEGTSETEKYQGYGWGLLQVLTEMKQGKPLKEFAKAASYVLTRRVKLSPPERNEARWLKGWLNRCSTYASE